MQIVYIALGSNLGERLHMLSAARKSLAQAGKVAKSSPIYETAPMYVDDQPSFLNACVSLETILGPLNLLRCLKSIELEVGRTIGERFGPRHIDLDIVAWPNLHYAYEVDKTNKIAIPHPKLVERRFVLQPLADIEPNLMIPGLGSVKGLLQATDHQANGVDVYSGSWN